MSHIWVYNNYGDISKRWYIAKCTVEDTIYRSFENDRNYGEKSKLCKCGRRGTIHEIFAVKERKNTPYKY